MSDRLYFDHAATTPLDPDVRAAMLPWLGAAWGNPSSLHAEGRAARGAVDAARRQVADLVDAAPADVTFTGSGTEADNLALRGILAATADGSAHVITSAIEHPAVHETCRALERGGATVTYLPVGSDGVVDPADLEAALRPETRLVSIMAANNVVGTIQPVRELGRIARARGVPFHTDAVQAAGKLPLSLRDDPIDLLSLSGHKLYGPQGVGALVRRPGLALAPVLFGGGQERGLRSGTENVAAIVGFGAAARAARAVQAEESARLVGLRERLLEGVLARVPGAYLIGDRFRRLPGHLCLGFAGLEGEAIKLLLALDEAGVAVSTGSACSAHRAAEPSQVLTAMGFDPFRARGGLRLTLGRSNTEEQVHRLLDILVRAVTGLRPIARRAGLSTGVPA